MVSAVLTQLSNRQQVEKVLNNINWLIRHKNYDCNVFVDWQIEKTIAENLIKSLKESDLRWVWFYKRKYKTIIDLLKRFVEIDLNLDILNLRKDLLSIRWIWKETADAVLCYGLDKKIFVVDNYTYKVIYNWLKSNNFDRFTSVEELKRKYPYDKLREIIENLLKHLGKDNSFYFKNLHWAFVEEGKRVSKDGRWL